MTANQDRTDDAGQRPAAPSPASGAEDAPAATTGAQGTPAADSATAPNVDSAVAPPANGVAAPPANGVAAPPANGVAAPPANGAAAPSPSEPSAPATEAGAAPADHDDRGEHAGSPERADGASTEVALSTGAAGGGSSVLVLGQNDQLEISGLAPEQVSALRMQYAQGMIEVQKKATELKVDVDALDHTLRSLTSQTESATRAGVSITATHSQSTSLGRTEVILGNTEQAAKGKLSRLQSGAEDNPILYVAVLAGAIILGAMLIALLS